VVRGHHVEEAKKCRARELRREMTPAERALWARLRGNRLDGLHFRRQQIIHGFIADFYCHAAAFVVEVDGPVHDEQSEADAGRDEVFRSLGLRVFRFTNEAVFQRMDDVLRRIAEVCRERKTLPNPPAPFPEKEGGASGSKSPRVSNKLPPACSPARFGEGSGEGLS
jgi:very-short-patch-repair endonuclease